MTRHGANLRLRPRPDGLLDAAEPLVLPIMAPRLQGYASPEGRLELSLWGSGRLGIIRFTALEGPFVYGPNRIEAKGGGIYAATSAPALLVRGARLKRIHPARSPAPWWMKIDAPKVTTEAGGLKAAVMPWGVLKVCQAGDDLIITAGGHRAEARVALELTAAQIIAEADAHARRCDGLPGADPEMRSMVIQGLHAALSSIRRHEDGSFAGLAAGLAYSAPARTYFRDGYWTLQALLTLAPKVVAEEIELLSHGVHPDGEAPSAVIVADPVQAKAWREKVKAAPHMAKEHAKGREWWSDHFDSPLFFILMIGDYERATGDRGPADQHWSLIKAIFERYRGFCAPGEALPLKPRHDRDWADNVFREGYVAYNLGLWIGVLDVIARLGDALDPLLAREAAALGLLARIEVEAKLSVGDTYADYAAGEFIEDHLTLDSLTLLRNDAVPEGRALIALEAVRNTLESRANRAQPWGDWGMICAYPPFKRRRDVRAKTAFAFRYHNGADWPYLSGLYGWERLRRGLPGWRYPLTRWWRTSLENGWAGAVEYFSPPFGRGSLLQGWSAMPAAAVMAFAATVLAGDPEA